MLQSISSVIYKFVITNTFSCHGTIAYIVSLSLYRVIWQSFYLNKVKWWTIYRSNSLFLSFLSYLYIVLYRILSFYVSFFLVSYRLVSYPFLNKKLINLRSKWYDPFFDFPRALDRTKFNLVFKWHSNTRPFGDQTIQFSTIWIPD